MRNTDSQLPCPSTDTDTLSSEDNSENDGASKIIAGNFLLQQLLVVTATLASLLAVKDFKL